MKNLTFLIILLISASIYSCSNDSKNELKSSNTKLSSTDFKTSKERVEELKKHITVYSDFHDAEFELFNVNGNFNDDRLSIPGASSWDYRFVIQLKQEDINKWTTESGMVIIKDDLTIDSIPWLSDLNSMLTNKIENDEIGEYYERKGDSNYAVTFRRSGIIFRRIINN